MIITLDESEILSLVLEGMKKRDFRWDKAEIVKTDSAGGFTDVVMTLTEGSLQMPF